MIRLSDNDIKESLMEAVSERCASSFARSLLSGADADEAASVSLTVESAMSGSDSVTLLFADNKGRLAERVSLSGDDARRALEHPRSIISAAKNYGASRITVCVRSVSGRIEGKTALSAAEYLSSQKKIRLSGFVFIGKDSVYSYKIDKAGASRRKTD